MLWIQSLGVTKHLHMLMPKISKTGDPSCQPPATNHRPSPHIVQTSSRPTNHDTFAAPPLPSPPELANPSSLNSPASSASTSTTTSISSRSLYPTPRFPSTFPQTRAWATFDTAPPDVLKYLGYGADDGEDDDDDDDDDGTIAAPLPRDSIRLVVQNVQPRAQAKEDDTRPLELDSHAQWSGNPPTLTESESMPLWTISGAQHSPYIDFGHTGYPEPIPIASTVDPHAMTRTSDVHVFSRKDQIHFEGSTTAAGEFGQRATWIDQPPIANVCLLPLAKAQATDNNDTHPNVTGNSQHRHQPQLDVDVASHSALCGLDIGIDALVRSASTWALPHSHTRERISSFFANTLLSEEELDLESECNLSSSHWRYGVGV